MTLDELPWKPHPLFPDVLRVRYKGLRILKGMDRFGYCDSCHGYEVMDREGDVHSTLTKIQAQLFLDAIV